MSSNSRQTYRGTSASSFSDRESRAVMSAEHQASTPMGKGPAATPPSVEVPPSGDFWGSWFSTVKQQALDVASKAQVIAENASKIASEQASQIVKQAQEFRENYDLEVSTSILMNTVGGPIQTTPSPRDSNIDRIRLTKADLNQLDMIYITENVLSMGFPHDKSKLTEGRQAKPRRTTATDEEQNGSDEGNDINIVAAYLRKKHQGRFMIWNISEESYDYSKMCDQVLEYRFPGHPAPPLGLLFKICTSVESWLDADEQNVAVIHCLTGKGRTSTLIACVLTWLGEFDSPVQALQYVANRRHTVVDYLTIPSQRRYIQYFSNLLDGVKPNSEPLLLKRVILNAIPAFGLFDNERQETRGCCPYIQLFKNGKLIATAAAYMDKPASDQETGGSDGSGSGKSALQLRWVNQSEGTTSFRLDCIVQGDILLRCRHASVSGARVSMFRAAFHTGYVSGGVLRLTKAQLDGTASDSRYSEDFFIDLIFAPLSEASLASPSGHNSAVLAEAAEVDKYESSIHKDIRFWESVAQRKIRCKKRRMRKFLASQSDQFSIADDSKLLIDPDVLTHIDFFATDAQSNEKKQQDMDLIKELAALEQDEAAIPITLSSDSNTTLQKPKIDSNALQTENSVMMTPQTPTQPANVKIELQALEDLEKELGLSDLHLFSNTKKADPSSSSSVSLTASQTTTPAKKYDVTEDDDNLDELEKYLQSLSTATPSSKP